MGDGPDSLNGGAAPRWTDGLRPTLFGWVAARVAVAAGFVVAHLLSGRVRMPYGRLHLDLGLMAWDGTFYRVITQEWYSGAGTVEDPSRFFPAYPALARAVRPLLAGNTDLALLLIANASAVVAGLVVYRLVAERFGDLALARRSAWMFAVIPAAGMLAFAYSESLMIAAVAVVLLGLHRDRPLVAAAGGLVAGMLRPTGVLLVVPVLFEAWRWYRSSGGLPRRQLAAWAASVAAPVVGLGAALWVVSRPEGHIVEAYRLQQRLRGGLRDPVTRLGQGVFDLARGELHDVYNLGFAAGFLFLFVVAVRRRQPPSWLALMAVTWLMAMSSTNIDSIGRYCLVAVPFSVALAQWAESRNRQVAVGVVGLGLMAWFTSEVLLGRVIP